MLKLYLFVLLSVCFSAANAQQEIIYNARIDLKSKKMDDTARLDIYERLITGYNFYNVDSAYYFLKEGNEYFSKLKDSELKTRALAVLFVCDGKIKEGHGELVEARIVFLKALELFYHIDFNKGVASVYNSLGIVEAKQANYKQATSYFLRSLTINERIHNVAGVIQSYVSLGVVNTHMENFNKAEMYLNKGLAIIKDTNNTQFCNILNNLANIAALKEDFKRALYFFERSYKISENIINPALSATLRTNLANCYSNLGQPQKALQFYKESLDITQEQQIPEEEARVLYNIALLYENSNPKLAIKYMEDAINICKKINQRYLLLEIYQSLYVSKRNAKDFEGAFEALELYHSYNDTLLSNDSKNQIELIQSNFDLEKSKSEIKELELQAQKQQSEKIIAFLVIAGTLLLLGVVAVSSYRRKKLNQALTHSVHVRDKLLSIIAHDLKSPINNVLSLVLELDTDELSKDEKHMLLEVLKKQTQLSLVTLENILKWGQAQIRGLKTYPEEFFVSDVVQKNIDLFDVNIKQKDINVLLDFNNSIKAISDPDQFDFIIRNLLSNAIKFSNHHSDITIRAVPMEKNKLRISIADQGVGMNNDTLVSLFGVKPKVNYGTEQEKGSGLGLLLCKEFVEANNGVIWAESILNEGSIICFTVNAA